MARAIPASVFICSDIFCVEAMLEESSREPERNEEGVPVSIPVDMKVKRAFLLRGAFPPVSDKEMQEVVDAFAQDGVEAIWVDTKSDARAMSDVVEV